MSPTRRQLLAGIVSIGTTGIVAGHLGASTADAHPHQHSFGRLQEARDRAAEEAIDAFTRMERLAFTMIITHPDTGTMLPIMFRVEDGRLDCQYFADHAPEMHRTIDITPDLALLPRWIAQPIGEHLLEMEATS